MNITLYKNISSSNTIRPTLRDKTVVSGVFNETVDIRSPTIKIGASGLGLEGFRKFNYCEFNGLKYFIEDISIDQSSMCVMNLKCDVLNSFSELNDVEILAERDYGDTVDYKLPNTTHAASRFNEVNTYPIYEINTDELNGRYVVIVSNDGVKSSNPSGGGGHRF